MPDYLVLLHDINFIIELLLGVFLAIAIILKKIQFNSFSKTLLIYFLYRNTETLMAELVMNFYPNPFPVWHIGMPIETIIVSWFVASNWQQLQSKLVYLIVLCISLGIVQELITQDLLVNNWMYSVFHYSFICVISYLTLHKIGNRIDRISFIALATLLMHHLAMLTFILFENQCRSNSELLSYVYPMVITVTLIPNIIWLFVEFLLFKQHQPLKTN
jgi:hypothetical protein